jgi:heme o synthase
VKSAFALRAAADSPVIGVPAPAVGTDAAAPARIAERPGRTRDFLALTKPRLNLLVLVTALGGMYLAAPEGVAPWTLFHALVGTALVAGGASALNQVWERDTDRLMRRTRMRPVPDGRLQAGESTLFGVALSAAGLIQLATEVNVLSAAVAATTLASYVLLYTPLKRRTWLSTLLGAFPGALPPVIGWAAATGEIPPAAITLFGIVFLWLMPHFLSIAWLYREDYARAGLPLLPVVEPDGVSTGRQALAYAAALIPVSVAPVFFGLGGPVYVACALVLGTALLALSVQFARVRSTTAARRLFFASIAYLPILWAVLVVDRLWL